METLTVLMTGAGSPGAYGIIKSWKAGAKVEKRKLRIIACDMNPDSYGFHMADKAYTIPRGDSPDFVPKLLDICKKEKPAAVFSWVDPELLPISKTKRDFEALGAKVTLAGPQAIETGQNKRKCYEIFSKDGITPDFRVVKTSSEFEKAVKELKGNAVGCSALLLIAAEETAP